MEIYEIIDLLKDIPTWGWIVLAVVILFFFGDRKRWEYEVKFTLVEGFGHGEVEIEATGNKVFKKEKMKFEIELELKPEAQNKGYDVCLNDVLLRNITEQETQTSRVRIQEKYNGEKPNEGDTVKIKHNNKIIFSGKLYKD